LPPVLVRQVDENRPLGVVVDGDDVTAYGLFVVWRT
jgi:hypothetical protein